MVTIFNYYLMGSVGEEDDASGCVSLSPTAEEKPPHKQNRGSV